MNVDTVASFPTVIPFPKVLPKTRVEDIISIATSPPSNTTPTLQAGDPVRNAFYHTLHYLL